MKKKAVTTEVVDLPYRTPQEVPKTEQKPYFTTNQLKEEDLPPLRKTADMHPFKPVINRPGNNQPRNYLTTRDLPSDLEAHKDEACLPCDERSILRTEKRKAKKEAQKPQVIQEFDPIVPWMDADGNFKVLTQATYKELPLEEKRIYNLAKGRESRKKKK